MHVNHSFTNNLPNSICQITITNTNFCIVLILEKLVFVFYELKKGIHMIYLLVELLHVHQTRFSYRCSNISNFKLVVLITVKQIVKLS